MADKRDYLFVAINDFSLKLYATILSDKTIELLIEQPIEACPYLIESAYSDNGTEYQGLAKHAFGVACDEKGIGQLLPGSAREQINGKVGRVIMQMRDEKQGFDSREHRQNELCRLVNFYNTVKPHGSLDGNTLFEVLQASFPTCGVNNPVGF